MDLRPAALNQALTRARQVWDYLTKRPTFEDEAWARQYLVGAELALYLRMHRYDRYHCTRVARRFAALEPPDWAIKGALLHDCGKPRGYGLIWRILVVVVSNPAIAPEPRARTPWRWAYQLYRHHGRYGAELARQAGLPEAACVIIHEHHHRAQAPEAPWLADFQRIDDD